MKTTLVIPILIAIGLVVTYEDSLIGYFQGRRSIGLSAQASTGVVDAATDSSEGKNKSSIHAKNDKKLRESSGRPNGANEALSALLAGNQRFVQGASVHPHESSSYRASLANEQHPFATVLACSDSRVTPVLIFDQEIGDLFVIRVAGNIVDDDVTGSIEYAVDHLGAELLVVMGHENCGAVTAAYHSFVAKDLEKREPHEVETLLTRIEPALHGIDRKAPQRDQIAQGVEENVRTSIEQLLRIPDLHSAQEEGRMRIAGAIYSLRTGEVRFLED